MLSVSKLNEFPKILLYKIARKLPSQIVYTIKIDNLLISELTKINDSSESCVRKQDSELYNCT